MDDIQNLKNKIELKDVEIRFLLQKVKSLYVKLDKKEKDINYLKKQVSHLNSIFECSIFDDV